MRMTLPGTAEDGNKYLGIQSTLQSKSTKVARDFSMLPIVIRYYLSSSPGPSIFTIQIIYQTRFLFKLYWIEQAKLAKRQLLLMNYNEFLPLASSSEISQSRSRNNINIPNRMKRSSASSVKQNELRATAAKILVKKQVSNQNHTSFNSTNSLLNEHSTKYTQTSSTYFEQLYSTFGSNNFAEWSRPESKQVYRKLNGRPETSKGIRPIDKIPKRWTRGSKEIGFHSQYMAEKISKQGQEELGPHIEIIVTKSQKKGKVEGPVRSKFETDLDDEFLQLFAN